ncbi:aspartyl protease family protein [Fontivita pretiosa]|uniref:aspartyl protease family protein n=1 Tax=Fontivita pretiosa TaxID=2989684 RepID=UPI003D16AE69
MIRKFIIAIRVSRPGASQGSSSPYRYALALGAALIWSAASLANEPIEGVQAAALDQPRVYLNLRRSADGPMLKTADAEPLSAVEAFLDTGASGVMLAGETVRKLGIVRQKTRDGKEVIFEDTGIAGAEKFGVTEPLLVSLAAYPRSNPEAADYSQPIGPIRMQVRPPGGLLELVAPGLDVAGMPVMLGKVVVLDPKPLADFDKIRTSVVLPDDASIPKTSLHVPLTAVSFARFTRVHPPDAPGPDMVGNPMIGPDPFKPDDPRKPVVVRYRGRSVSGTFLLDTGAATSLISTKLAKELNLRVADNGELPDVPKEQKFQLLIGGLGGGKQASGTFFDRLELPTRQGPPIVFAKAPLLVADITVTDPQGKPYTLDGILGMNYLVASAEITGGLLPDIGKIVAGPWRWIVIDFKSGVLGLEPQ